ncbi:MAG: non-hydrolyzing UDP-N-acetylglucosamine 2-epimerase [Lutibacter sp.]
MKKLVTIIGARPQFIKAAVLSHIIKTKNEIKEIIIHTGQHFDENMSAVFFNEMNIPKPDYFLAVNQLSHGAMTGKMIEKIENILLKEKPHAVLVYGDTNSTLAGALAAKKIHFKIIHVEAGLRSFNMNMPEEINRILTDRISDLCCCPTNQAVENLVNEGFKNYPCKILNTGDIMKDSVNYFSALAQKKSNILKNLSLLNTEFVLATIHREDNTTSIDNLKEIVSALNKINESCKVIVPLHPRTKAVLKQNKIGVSFKIIEPIGYFDMLQLLKYCRLVITDSGGLQKEAYFNKKNCIVLRNETEWIELVNHKVAHLTGANTSKILASFNHFMTNKSNFNTNLYGTHPGENIYKAIKNII